MRSRYNFVTKRQIAQCKYCGADIVWQKYAKGGFYPSDVIRRDGELMVIAGSGNHYNLKQRHDCLAEARTRIRSLEENIAIIDAAAWSDEKIAEYRKGLAETDWTKYPNQKEQAERWLNEALEAKPKFAEQRAKLVEDIAHYQARLDKETKS